MATFQAAAQPDIVRSWQKDDYYARELERQIAELTTGLLGVRASLKYQKEIRMLADGLIYALTTLFGNRTLGEEYCDIVQIRHKSGGLPSTLTRAGLVFWQSVAPYLWDTGLVRASAAAREHQDDSGGAGALARAARRGLPLVRSCAAVLTKWHLALFYFFGIYYQLSKRLCGVRYIFARRQAEQRPKYGALGALIALQLAASAAALLHATLKARRAAAAAAAEAGGGPEALVGEDWAEWDESLEEAGPLEARAAGTAPEEVARKCALCLEPRTRPTATQCGHIFCWDCIVDWCRERAECPLCRSPASLRALLVLTHYT